MISFHLKQTYLIYVAAAGTTYIYVFSLILPVL